MSTQTAEVVPIKNLPAVVAGGQARALVPQDIEGAWRVAGYLHDAGILPYGINTRSQVMIAIMHGLEIGLPPMQALQSIAVINGKPTVYGDAAIGLVRTSGLLEWIEETIEGEGDAMVARCVVKRKGEAKPITGEFSVEDAKLAKLWGKTGKHGEPTPWVTYPKRMLKNRARAFALRDAFADVLRGMHVREEVEDYTETGAHQGADNAKVVNDDGPPAPPPVPTTPSPPTAPAETAETVTEAEIIETKAETVQAATAAEDDGPPDPTATVAPQESPQERRGRSKMPSPEDEPVAFLAWLKDRLSECDADMLESSWNDSLSITVERLSREHYEAALGLYRERERELDAAPVSTPGGDAVEARLLTELAALKTRMAVIKWTVANKDAIAGLSPEARGRVEQAMNQHGS